VQALARVRPAAAAGSWVVVLAGLLFIAASIHVVLTPEHFDEGPHFGAFFLATAVLQFGLAYTLLLRPGSAVYREAAGA